MKDFSEYGLNPYKSYIEFDVKEVKKKEALGFTKATSKGTFLMEPTKSYTRLYRTKKWDDVLMAINSGASLKLLLYVSSHLRFGSEVVFLDSKSVSSTMNCSTPTYFNARRELLKLSIIQKTNLPNYYWINPEVLYYGSRIKRFEDNYRVRV